jgi:hypothetical protein
LTIKDEPVYYGSTAKVAGNFDKETLMATLKQDFFTAGMYIKNGELHEISGRRVDDAELKRTILKQRDVMHGYYISPGTPKMMREESQYLGAIENIARFMELKPELDKMGIDYQEATSGK